MNDSFFPPKMPFYGKMSGQQCTACRIIFLPKMRSIIPSGKKMRKRIAKYPIPNFKIQIQFLNRNGEQFAFAVKSSGRFLPFRKKNGAVRRCPSVFAAGRNIRRNGARNGINGHGLKQNLARSRHNGVEKAFSAEEQFLTPRTV